MLSISSISLSGIVAGGLRMHVSADNVARYNVPHSERNRVTQEADATGGTSARVEKVPLGEEDFESDGFFHATNIDYAQEAMMQTLATTSTRASIAFYNKADALEEEVINILA